MDGAGETILRLKAENQELRDEVERTTKALAIREETVRRLRRDLADRDMEIARLGRSKCRSCNTSTAAFCVGCACSGGLG